MDENELMGEKMACSSLFASFFRSQLKETLLPPAEYSPSPSSSSSSSSSSWLAVGGRSVKKMIPILEWAPRYNLATFQADLLAGITAAILSVPQGISYARLANLHPIVGLYSSFVPPLIYAVLGTSTNVAAGSTAAISLFLGSLVGNEISPSDSPELYMYVLFTVTFFTGVFEAALGLFRLGIVVDLFSRSTITGFMGGTAIVVILQQLKGVLGMKHFTTNTDLVSVVASIVSHRDEWRWESAVLGTCLLSFLLFTKYMRRKFTRLFWLPAVGPLAVVVLGALFAYSVHAEDHGILIVGPVNKGLNPVSISDFKFESKHLGLLLRAALISGFLALSEGIAVGRSLAIMKNEQIDSNQEMIAFGFMNIIGSCFSCYVTTGPFSKSAVNFHAGSRTAMSNAVMSACVMLVLLFLAPLFKYTPLVALSAIIIVAVTGLFEWEEARRLFRVDRFDFLVCMTAFLGVVFFSTTVGLLASVGLSILRALLYVARPSIYELGCMAGTETYCNVRQYPSSIIHPGILILKLGSPVYSAGAGYLRERILSWIEEEEEKARKKKLQYLVLDMSGVTSIDSSGISMLLEVHRFAERRGIKTAVANPSIGVAEKLKLAKYTDLIDEESVFLSVREAVEMFRLTQELKNKEELI